MTTKIIDYVIDTDRVSIAGTVEVENGTWDEHTARLYATRHAIMERGADAAAFDVHEVAVVVSEPEEGLVA